MAPLAALAPSPPLLVAAGYLLTVVGARWYTCEAPLDKQTAQVLLVQFALFCAVSLMDLAVFPADLIVAVLATSYTYIVLIRGQKYRHVDMSGKVVIVTGSNTGIGLETAREIARMGADVVLACRTKWKGEAAVEEILKSVKPSKSQTVKFLQCDLGSKESIEKFVAEFNKLKLPLHVLINNAGMMSHKRRVSSDGIEMTFQANYLGPFYLTELLLKNMKATKGESRIINVNSSLHFLTKAIRFDDPEFTTDYEMFRVYSHSKLAGMLFTAELTRRLKLEGANISVNSLHPGLVMTEVTRNMHWLMRYAELAVLPFMYLVRKTAPQGAYTSIHVATSPALAGVTGKYFVHCQPVACSSVVDDEKVAERLWKMSKDMLIPDEK